MRRVLFVQGGGANVHAQWDNRLVDSLRNASRLLHTLSSPMTIQRCYIVPLVVALAVGCTREPDRATTGDTAATVPSSSSARPAVAAPAALVVTERGIGPLQAGMTLAEGRAALGGALVVLPGSDTTGCDYVDWRGGPPGVRVMIEGGRIARVDVTAPPVATADGARVGDTEARVQALYPGRVAVTPHKYEEGHYLTVTPASGDTSVAIVFEAVKGQVTRYRAGRRPQVEYVEGCG